LFDHAKLLVIDWKWSSILLQYTCGAQHRITTVLLRAAERPSPELLGPPDVRCLFAPFLDLFGFNSKWHLLAPGILPDSGATLKSTS
jgi:hypothetical protein